MCRTNNGGQRRHLVTIACFAGALVGYISGAHNGAMLLLVLGGLLELAGWRPLD